MTQQKAPLVSVIMPSYNHARYIGRAAESVLGQTAGDLELIVVDNHSTDGTDEVLAAIKDPRLRVVKIANGGIIAASRNLGLKNAAGEFAAFIDSDDIWLPEKLERQLEALRAAPGAVLAYSRFKTLTGDAASEEIFPRPAGCVSGRVFGRLYLKHFIACSGVLARRDALLAAGGFSEDRELVAIEDSDLWLRLAQKAEIVCSCDRALFLYRVHPGGASTGSWRRLRRELLLARRHAAAAGPVRHAAAACLSFAAALQAELAALLPGRAA